MKYIKMISVVIVLVGLLNNAKAADTGLQITSPKQEAEVSTYEDIAGTITDTNSTVKVWIVVHPIETHDYWVSCQASVSNGKWEGKDAQFGETDQHSGKRFEIIAVADPKKALRKGQKLGECPEARLTSTPVRVTKK
jgi:hypothetical protein